MLIFFTEKEIEFEGRLDQDQTSQAVVAGLPACIQQHIMSLPAMLAVFSIRRKQ